MSYDDLKKMASFGVAGNFTGHLEQAGEASDFKNVVTKEENAPKALFPTFIPGAKDVTPAFLGVFPFCDDKIIFPKDEEKIQIEPECALILSVKWNDGKVDEIHPECFAASNDCSIRKQGAKKISLKKNWGKCTKGVSSNWIPLDSFDADGNINRYRIASFLVREGQVFDYGEDSAVKDYSYIYGKLLEWIKDKLNNQKDEGPAENIHEYLLESGNPEKILVSIGATRYTDFGEHNFLLPGDKAAVAVYPENISHEDIVEMVKKEDLSEKSISFLVQDIILE